MLKNYLLSGLRHVMQHKVFAFINVFGMAIGLASCFAILLFVKDELSYDTFWQDSDQLYTISWQSTMGGRQSHLAATPGPLAPRLALDFADEFEAVTHIRWSSQTVVKDGQGMKVDDVYFTNDQFFNVFQMPFLVGDMQSALSNLNSVVLSKSTAERLFGHQDVLGETVELVNGRSLTVTGVVQDLPDTSHLDFTMIAPIRTEDEMSDGRSVLEMWENIGFYTYVKAKAGVDPATLHDRYETLLDNHAARFTETFVPSKTWDLVPIQVRDIYLHGAPRALLTGKGDMNTLYIFMAIAVMILAIACINFMNLSTARSSLRAREVAVRKVMGASERQVVSQFMSEAGLMVLIAFVISLALLELFLPVMNEILRTMLVLDYVGDPMVVMSLIGLAGVVTLAAGSHPSFVAARYRPSKVLRGGRAKPAGSSVLRSVLVVVQFSVSIFLMIAALITYRQLDHLQSMDKGFNSAGVISVRGLGDPNVRERYETFRNALMRDPAIEAVGASWIYPGFGGRTYVGIDSINGEVTGRLNVVLRNIDYGYFDASDMTIVAGRAFSKDFSMDNIRVEGTDQWRDGNIIINEQTVAAFNLGSVEDAVGSEIRMDGNLYTIVGVVGDIYVGSGETGFEPMLYVVDPDAFRFVHVKSAQGYDAMEATRKVWQQMFPVLPFEARYLDEVLAGQFSDDKVKGQMFAVFAVLAGLVSCLGLYGLASLSIEQRTKEIGIRKVMGAGVQSILKLMLWQFSKPVLVASFIAMPLAWVFASDWITTFPSRISLDFIYFIVPTMMALLLAWLTVGSHTLRAASTNPVKALRQE